jgi:hypothetical protein
MYTPISQVAKMTLVIYKCRRYCIQIKSERGMYAELDIEYCDWVGDNGCDWK